MREACRRRPASLAETYGVDVQQGALGRPAARLGQGVRRRRDPRAALARWAWTWTRTCWTRCPRLLHGPTAAAELVRAYPDLSADVVQAIARHTAAAVGMSDLDMIIYIADAIEPSRDFDGLDELRAAIGAVPLEELFMMTFNHILLTLVERRRRLHPATVEVWNHYVARSRDAKAEKGTA